MTEGLTSRQTQILKTIIDEYIATAEPVGSEALDKKYNLGVSPATIRNEMVSLTKLDFLKQPHASAGRVPTPVAMKFYINQLMEEKQMSVVDEVKAKEEVWDARDDMDELMDEATHALASRTKSLAVAGVKDDTGGSGKKDRFWYAGHSYIFQNPEFSDVVTCQNLFPYLKNLIRLIGCFSDLSQSLPWKCSSGKS